MCARVRACTRMHGHPCVWSLLFSWGRQGPGSFNLIRIYSLLCAFWETVKELEMHLSLKRQKMILVLERVWEPQ